MLRGCGAAELEFRTDSGIAMPFYSNIRIPDLLCTSKKDVDNTESDQTDSILDMVLTEIQANHAEIN